MRKGIRRRGAWLVTLLPLAGCLDWIDLEDYVRPGLAPSPPASVQPVSGPLCGVERLADVVELYCAKERAFCEQWAECPDVFTPLEDCLAERGPLCVERARYALQ